MPLPLGHTAIGLATYETVQDTDHHHSRLGTFVLITVLANLPDVDVIMGLFLQGNGNFFHRGPTHSFLFAILAGYAATHLWRLWEPIPRLGFLLCVSLVFSHVLADMLFTTAPVSLLWPFQLYWSPGFSGWENVVHAVLFQSIRDGGIIVACVLYVGFLRLLRGTPKGHWVPAVMRRRLK
jgi:membrane-bound metal-dependent hydrolase YbcI (DUF457 family)